jgi:hypothetical protein
VRKLTLKVIAMSGLLLTGCVDQDATNSKVGTSIARFGLIESSVDHQLLLSALEFANSAMPNGGRRFVPGWEANQLPASIPVHTVRGRLGSREIMTTYPECRCIVVQAGKLHDWLTTKVGSGPALLTIEPRLILAYMLLHEAGHIEQDSGVENEAPLTRSQSGKTNNLDTTAQKWRETTADVFAAEVVKSGMQEKGNRGLAATRIAMALSQLAWNLAEHRLLDDFGGTALRKPSLFQDVGSSHPNLEWRVLSVNDLITGSDTSRQLLEDFERLRNAGTGSVLWQPTK